MGCGPGFFESASAAANPISPSHPLLPVRLLSGGRDSPLYFAPMHGEITDEMLMLRYREGDVDAFDSLFSRHNGGIYRFFLRQRQTLAHAEELAQDVWMRVIQAADGYEVTARFTTWIYRIAHNRLIDHVRGVKARPEDAYDELPETIAALGIPEFEWPENLHERRQVLERLARAVAELPPDQAEAFLLKEEAELTLEEIAAVTGVGRETVKSRLRYAVARLRGALAELR